MKNKHAFFRSPMFYVGDKYKILSEITPYFPTDISRYIEPFAGGGSVFMNVSAKIYELNDIDSYMIKLHKFLRKSARNKEQFFKNVNKKVNQYNLSYSYIEDIVPKDLKTQYKKTYFAKYNKDGYIKLRTDFNASTKKEMLDLYLLLIYGFNRMLRFNSKGNFNLPVGNVDFNKNVYNALNEYFDIIQKINTVWSNLDYKKFIANINVCSDDFVYLDPPYLITFSEYNKLWNEKEEMELLSLLDNLDAKGVRFAISNVTHYKGKTNEIFIAWAKKYNSHSIKSNYISYHDNSIKSFKEVLITNY